MTTTNEIYDAGDLRKYRTEIPNIVDDTDLSVYAFRLYVHMKRVAGANPGGACFQSTRDMAMRCKMSKSQVSRAKKELQEAGLIEIKERDRTKGEADYITIVNIWDKNFEKYAPQPPWTAIANSSQSTDESQKGVPDMDRGVPVVHGGVPVVGHIRKNQYKKEQLLLQEGDVEKISSGGGEAQEPAKEIPDYFTGEFAGEEETSKDVEEEVLDSAPPSKRDRRIDEHYGELCSVYEGEIGLLTPMIAEELSVLLDEFPLSLILTAIRISVGANVRKLSYIKGILAKWRTDGLDGQREGNTTVSDGLKRDQYGRVSGKTDFAVPDDFYE